MTYTVWLPFALPEGREISGLAKPMAGLIEGFATELEKLRHGYYALKVSGLPTEADAGQMLKKLGAGLLWTALEQPIGLKFDLTPQRMFYSEDPIKAGKNVFGPDSKRRVDTIVDASAPAVYLDGKATARVEAGKVSVLLSTGGDVIFEKVKAGVSIPNPIAAITDQRLRLAVDLYCLSHFQVSEFARFLALCTALEAVAPQGTSTQTVLNKIDGWIEQAVEEGRTAAAGSAEKEEFEALASRIGYLKSQSHRARIRRYVQTMLERAHDPDAPAFARRAAQLYDLRGNLVHTGRVDLGTGLSELDTLVRKTLRAAMAHARV